MATVWWCHTDSAAEHHVLIDGGPAHAYDTGLRKYLLDRPKLRHFELMILTHVDTDHIDGALCLLNDVRHGALSDLVIDEVWFNGWEQLTGRIDDRGPQQGDYFAYLLRSMEFSLNAAFGGNAVCRDLSHEIELPGGATLTVLSPSKRELDKMRAEWVGVLTEADYDPGKAAQRLSNKQMYQPKARGVDSAERTKRPGSDVSAPNGSSIGVLFEYAGQRLLLAGDAHAAHARRVNFSLQLPVGDAANGGGSVQAVASWKRRQSHRRVIRTD